MNEPIKENTSSWLTKINQILLREPQNTEQLLQLLRLMEQRHILDSDTLAMLEGVLCFAKMQARDVMLPRQQMVVIPITMSLEAIFDLVTHSGHSRFPVIGDNRDEVLGILHAKDLLALKNQKFYLNELLRPATIVPESKQLNILLAEFRLNRNHMAIVVDEYGAVSGFITIEDILEQIVGDIEDEFDIDEDAYIKKHENNTYIIKAHMPITELNEYLHLNLKQSEFDTLGGMLMKNCEHLPKRGDKVMIEHYQFKILNADSRRIKLVEFINKGEP